MTQYREIIQSVLSEAAKSIHPMAVHAYPTGNAGQFKVHATGAKVHADYIKPGDTVSSSDLDDLSAAGHKVKEIKAPVTGSAR